MAWGICSTVKAPLPEIEAFIAHHLAIGADHIWLHFDDPDDPARDAVAGYDGVTTVACTDDYWKSVMGRRPDAHQIRQTMNMQRIYHSCDLPWLAHIDVDEFILPIDPVDDTLDAVAGDVPMLRMVPWEALHAPRNGGVFDSHLFRGPLKGAENRAYRRQSFGPYAAVMNKGLLSHTAGKAFFRTGIAGMEPRIHTAWLNGEQMKGIEFSESPVLLHFHAHDREDWTTRLPFRIERGAYRGMPGLIEALGAASPEEIDAFYDQVMTVKPELQAKLVIAGMLIDFDLHLPQKVAALKRRALRPSEDRH